MSKHRFKRDQRDESPVEDIALAIGDDPEKFVDPEGVDSPDSYTVIVERHTHAGVSYNSGDPIVLDNPASVRKLKAKGIIS